MQATQLQIADLQGTIGKYRELVQQLQMDKASLTKSSEDTQPILSVTNNLEIKSKLSETKIQAKVTDKDFVLGCAM